MEKDTSHTIDIRPGHVTCFAQYDVAGSDKFLPSNSLEATKASYESWVW
jgi:hypothetical protein